MLFRLATLIQDNFGQYHRPGEYVEVIGQLRELGTRRVLFRVVWADGTRGIALPADLNQQPVSAADSHLDERNGI